MRASIDIETQASETREHYVTVRLVCKNEHGQITQIIERDYPCKYYDDYAAANEFIEAAITHFTDLVARH